MGDYFVGSDGELYHWGWKKKDAKYIKRERKNGKWVYTYPEDLNNSSKKPVVSVKNNKASDGIKPIGNTKKTSSEYDAEVAYNSQKNTWSITTATRQDTANKVSSGKNAVAKGSSEYDAEKAYNSQKNVYPVNTTSKTSEKESEKTAKKNNWLEEAKKTLDNLGDWASEKLKDIGDNIEDFGDDVKDWVDDKADDLYDATIGEAKDALGYDERDYFYEAKQNYDRCDKSISDKMDRFMKMLNPNTSADSVNSTAKTLEYEFRDWAKADAEYAYAKAKYDASVIGRIDNWINGNDVEPKSAAEIEDLRIAARAMQTDASLAIREGKYLANVVMSDALFFGAHPLNTSKEINVHANSVNAWDDLMDYTRLGEEMGHWDGVKYSSIESDRLERMRVELYMRYIYTGYADLVDKGQ